MRLRWQRRLRKQLRRMSGHERSLAVTAAKMERQGIPLVKTLLTIMLDPTKSHFDRAAIGKLLSVGGDGRASKALLKLFFEQTEKNDLSTTALTLEELDDRTAVPPLIRAPGGQQSAPAPRCGAGSWLDSASWPSCGTGVGSVSRGRYATAASPRRSGRVISLQWPAGDDWAAHLRAPQPRRSHPILGHVRIGQKLPWRRAGC